MGAAVLGGRGRYLRRSLEEEIAAIAGKVDDILAKQSGLVIPGTDKREADSGPLAPPWGLARESLKAADGAVFIGFRFPEMDAAARQMIVDALGEKGGPDRRTNQVVLGPHSPDSERVVNILQFACRNGGRHVEDSRMSRYGIVWDFKLYAEDYLSVASRFLLRA